MKNLILAGALTAMYFGGFAQDTTMQKKSDYQQNQGTQQHKSDKACAFTLKNGKVMKMENGKSVPLDKTMTLANGNTIMTDGTVKMKDGTTMKLTEGQCLNMSGKMIKNTEMKENKPMGTK